MLGGLRPFIIASRLIKKRQCYLRGIFVDLVSFCSHGRVEINAIEMLKLMCVI